MTPGPNFDDSRLSSWDAPERIRLHTNGSYTCMILRAGIARRVWSLPSNTPLPKSGCDRSRFSVLSIWAGWAGSDGSLQRLESCACLPNVHGELGKQAMGLIRNRADSSCDLCRTGGSNAVHRAAASRCCNPNPALASLGVGSTALVSSGSHAQGCASLTEAVRRRPAIRPIASKCGMVAGPYGTPSNLLSRG